MLRRAISRAGLAAAAALAIAGLSGAMPAAAQQWPGKPVRLVIPYAPGGISDIAARLIGARLTDTLGQQFVVDNRPGGSGTIGMGAVAKSPPDGYSWVIATVGDFTISPHIIRDIPYNPLTDLAPVMSLTDTPCVLAVTAASPYQKLSDVTDAARKAPGKVGYATPGVGAINQLLMEWMAVETGTSYNHVPYKGGAPAGTAVAAGDVQVGLLAASSVLAHVKGGKIRMLANTSATRSPVIPDVASMRELGIKDVDGSNYTLLAGPKGTPQAIIDRLHGEIAKALAAADLKEKLAAGAAVPIPSTPAELVQRLAREAAAFKLIIEKAKITAE